MSGSAATATIRLPSIASILPRSASATNTGKEDLPPLIIWGNFPWYYLGKEKRLKDDLKEQILIQMRDNACLSDNDYKQGLYDALNDALDELSLLENETP